MQARFATIRDLYAAFPTAVGDVGVAPNDQPCLEYLEALMQAGSWNAAVSFCAYLLPRREAIAWGCQSLRRMPWSLSLDEVHALDMAEAWVRKPEEDSRRAALEFGQRGDAGLPATWMALAVGWSGGNIGPVEFPHLRAPPEQTARAVRTGLFIAMARIPAKDVAGVVKLRIDDGVKMANNGLRS